MEGELQAAHGGIEKPKATVTLKTEANAVPLREQGDEGGNGDLAREEGEGSIGKAKAYWTAHTPPPAHPGSIQRSSPCSRASHLWVSPNSLRAGERVGSKVAQCSVSMHAGRY